MDTVTQIRMDTWRNERVVLVGDAAGCMTLISGQGASMALAGGYVLAEELGATDDWRQALANFEARVKPQMDIRQTKARDFAKRFVPGTRAAVKAQTALMKLITYHAFSGPLKSQFVGDSFLERPRHSNGSATAMTTWSDSSSPASSRRPTTRR